MTTSEPNCEIREIHPDDKDAWLILWKAYVEFYQANVSDAVTNQTWETFFADVGHKAFVAINDQGQLIGFATYLFHASTWTTNGYCYLEDLFVAKTSRGNGVGRALIQAVVAKARDADIVRVYWHTDTGNATARMLYDSVADLSDMVQYRLKLSVTR